MAAPFARDSIDRYVEFSIDRGIELFYYFDLASGSIVDDAVNQDEDLIIAEELDCLAVIEDTGVAVDQSRFRTLLLDADVIDSSRGVLTLLFIVEPSEYQFVQACFDLSVGAMVLPFGSAIESAVIERDIALGQSRVTSYERSGSRNEYYTQVVVQLTCLGIIVTISLPIVSEGIFAIQSEV